MATDELGRQRDMIAERELETSPASPAVTTVELSTLAFGRMLHNASLAVSKDATRPVLQCVRLTFSFSSVADGAEVTITATCTDSYTMIEDHTSATWNGTVRPAPDGLAYTLTYADLASSVKAWVKCREYDRLTLTLGDTLTITDGPATLTLTPFDGGEYPNTAQLWADYSMPDLDGGTITLDPARLGAFDKLLPRPPRNSRIGNGIRLTFLSNLKPTLVTSALVPTMRALVMPIRDDR